MRHFAAPSRIDAERREFQRQLDALTKEERDAQSR